MYAVGGRHSKTSSVQTKKSRISFVCRVGGWVVTCSETFLIVPCANSEVCTYRQFALIPPKQKNRRKGILDVKIALLTSGQNISCQYVAAYAERIERFV